MNQKTGKHIYLLTPSPSSSSFSPPPVTLPETEAEEEGEEPSELWLHIKSKRAGVRENRRHLRGTRSFGWGWECVEEGQR